MKTNEVDITGFDTLLLDRDGTINVHVIGDYVCRWEDFQFIPITLEMMPYFATKFKHIFVVTNQRGVGKRKYSEEDLADIHAHMISEIEKVGGRVDGIYYCTSLTEDDIRRKPGRGMFDDILRDHPDVDPMKTLMIGDDDVDRDFAKNCGIAFQCIDSMKRDGACTYWKNTFEGMIK